MSDLSPGIHIINASVTDSDGLTGSAVIDIAINEAPVVIIEEPPDESIFNEGETVNFVGNATDDLDGDLSSEIMWGFRCR